VESNGVSLHHAHNESTCVACRVLSFHSAVSSRALSGPAIHSASAVRPGALALRADSPTLLANASRAPPEIA
jgi:hypothetical protein